MFDCADFLYYVQHTIYMDKDNLYKIQTESTIYSTQPNTTNLYYTMHF